VFCPLGYNIVQPGQSQPAFRKNISAPSSGSNSKPRRKLATGWRTEWSEFDSRYGQKLSLLHVVQTGSGAHPAYLMGNGGSFPGVKRPGREADHSPPTSAEVKNTWLYTSTPPYVYISVRFLSPFPFSQWGKEVYGFISSCKWCDGDFPEHGRN
jgi:hypothetical protein